MKKAKRKALCICAMILLFGTLHVYSDVTIVPWPIIPSNDDCENAQLVGDVENFAFDTTYATFDGQGYCMTSPNIWYRYVAPGTGEVTVSLLGSSFDTKLAIYNGNDCNPGLNDTIECNDDFGNGFTSQITFQATGGESYLIEIGGFNSSDTGPGVLKINSDVAVPPPFKDNCISAVAIGDVTDLPFDTTNATFDGPGLCSQGANIWFCYTASCTGDVTVSLLGSSFDTMLAVYEECNCNQLNQNLIVCDDDSPGSYQSELTFAAVAGRQYLIEIGGYGPAKGQGVLNISCQGVPGPPVSKDNCANARSIGDVKNLPFDTTNATFDGPGLCMTSPNTWFCYTASCTGQVTVSLLGSAFDTMLAIYKGCDCNINQNDLIACNDDFEGSYQSKIVFDAVAGSQYLIEVGGYATDTGHGVLSVSCEPAAPTEKPDLGDAPDSTNNFGKVMRAYTSPQIVTAHFPTVFGNSSTGPFGPAHLNEQLVAYLGKTITAETEADKGADEDGINNLRPSINSSDNDGGDDGINLPLVLPDCGWAMIDYEVTVIKPGTDLWVNVWLDFNRDGDWDDEIDCPAGTVSEWAVRNQFLFDLPAGLNQITTPGFRSSHPKDRAEQIWMRITLSEQPWTGGSNPGEQGNAGSGPAGKYLIGETEDYFFVPQKGDGGNCPLCQDVNNDGVIDINDLAAFVSKWLANCQ